MDQDRLTELRQRLKALLDDYGVDLALDWYDYDACRLVIQERPGEDAGVNVDEMPVISPYVPPPPRKPRPQTPEQRAAIDRSLEAHFRLIDERRRSIGVLQAPKVAQPAPLRSHKGKPFSQIAAWLKRGRP